MNMINTIVKERAESRKVLNDKTVVSEFSDNDKETTKTTKTKSKSKSKTNIADTKSDSVLDEIRERNKNRKSTKKRINVSLSEEVFEKLITLCNGGSVSATMEHILSDKVKDLGVDEEIVRAYKETMSNKGPKQK